MANRLLLTTLFIQLFSNSLYYALPQVRINQGILQGTIHETRKGRNVTAFLGIPYAEPPVGKLRFSNPVRAKSWEGIRIADQDGEQCPQYNFSLISVGAEDCLSLNVYVPLDKFNFSMVNNQSREELPVMVWIHGGAFVLGSSNSDLHGVDYLLDKDIILVAMNYRLGIFGFLSTGDEIAPGNFGLKDQVLALEWVQENIQAFGGDPKKVTIFGESAGGVSVALHALSDKSDDLFQQYIIESGSPLAPWAFQNSSNYPPLVRVIARKVDCSFSNMTSIIKCFRNKTSTELLAASISFGVLRHQMTQFLKWTPTNEPKTLKDAFLIDSPINLINKKKLKDRPFITGNVLDEGLIITQYFYKDEITLNAASYLSYFLLKIKFPLINDVLKTYFPPESVTRLEKDIEKFYFKTKLFTSGRKLMEKFTEFLSDALFNYPQIIFVEKASTKIKSPIYWYSFNYEGSRSLTQLQTGSHVKEGVCHSDELFYLFPMNSLSPEEINNEKADGNMIDIMVDLWTSFAINGAPSYDDLNWVPYKQNFSYLVMDGHSNKPKLSMQKNYFKERMDFWRERAPIA